MEATSASLQAPWRAYFYGVAVEGFTYQSLRGKGEENMWKKLFILLAIVVVVAIALIPIWSSKMAQNAFENPNRKRSPKIIKKALLVKMRINEHKGARLLAEKAILYFPESKELPYFIYNAAISAEQEGKPGVAIYWYGIFIKKYPKHDWTIQADNKLKKLKGMHETP